MIPEQKIKKIAGQWLEESNYDVARNAATEMYEWCKENMLKEYRKELNECYKYYVKAQRLLIIEKAWNWLTEQKGERTIDDFKKAMEKL